MGLNLNTTSYADFKNLVADLKNELLQGFGTPPVVRVFYYDGGSPFQIVAVTGAFGKAQTGGGGAVLAERIAQTSMMIFFEDKGTFPASFSSDFPSGTRQLTEPINAGFDGWQAT